MKSPQQCSLLRAFSVLGRTFFAFFRFLFYLCRNCLVGTRYSGFGTRNLHILCLKSSKIPIIASRIPNSQSRLSNYSLSIYHQSSAQMNRINELFARKSNDILNIYFTAGYPNLNDTETIIFALEAAGADLIEIGMPYSDPLADGPTIQQSGEAALKNGMTLPILLEQIAQVRKKSNIPLVLMGYFNQVMQFGEARFFKACKKAGIDGVILPDLPMAVYEEKYQKICKKSGINVSFLITPLTTEERIRKADALSDGFIYMVSNSAITGAKVDVSDKQITYFERITAMNLKNPRLIGFGISNYATYRTACDHSNGAIIGSAFIKALTGSKDVASTTHDFVKMVRGEA
jgi:tryptophan synthase alpha chain